MSSLRYNNLNTSNLTSSNDLRLCSQATQLTAASMKKKFIPKEKIESRICSPENIKRTLSPIVIKIPYEDDKHRLRYKKSKIVMKDKRDTIRVPRFQIGAPMFSSENHFSSRNQKEKSYLSPEINIPRSRSILKKRRTLTLESNLSSKRRDTSNNKVRFGSEAVPVVQVFKVKSYKNEYKEMQQKYEQQRIENEKQKTVCSGVCIIF